MAPTPSVRDRASATSTWNVVASQSANTGRQLFQAREWADAEKVKLGNSTGTPEATAPTANMRPDVQLETATT